MIEPANRRSSAWLRNAWLAALGISLLILTFGLGYEGFSALVRKHYWAFHDSFLLADSRQVIWAYRFVRIAGACALLGYGLLGLLRFDLAAWLGGPRDDPHARWRGLLLTASTLAGAGFLVARVVGDARLAREHVDLSLPYVEYAGRYYDGNVNEHDYFAVRRFGAEHSGDALVILRGIQMYETPTSPWRGHLRIDHLHVSRNLYPDVRVYLRYAPLCDPSALDEQWLEERGVRWMIRDCDESFRFRVEPLAVAALRTSP